MNQKFIRVYKKFDLHEIKPHLMIYGDISAACGNCGHVNLKLSDTHCLACKAELKYISFRNVKNHIPKMHKLSEERPAVTIIDL
ncbi:MAG TPA: hypothetical protein DD723_06805, partial [Candidatus Omnitrophica bacterium]|nr:hypothetical protein [Candidatus Omnitrophota bacterium]